MKKLLMVTLAVVMLLALCVTPVFAAPGGKDSPANDNPNNLYLYEKTTTDWEIVWGGAWGKYNFKLSGEGADTTISGPFNGHGLVAGTNYTLIEYNGWWDVTVIGAADADSNGNVSIRGTAVVGAGGEEGEGLYKIWLVPTDEMATWPGNPPEGWLFEHNLIPNPEQ